MRAFDFWTMILCCLCWAGNFVMTAWVLGGSDIPPFILASARAAVVCLIMGVFLFRPLPKHFLRLLFVCLCVGPIHLGFLYTGLSTAPASGGSIISQALIPLSTIIAVFWLREMVGWRRGIAIIGAMIGVIVMIYEPGGFSFDVGLVYVFLAYLALAFGSVALRRVPDVDCRVYFALTGVLILTLSTVMTAVFDEGHREILQTSWKPLMLVALYAALTVSIFAHGQYFRLLQTYPVNTVVPLSLMTTVFACILGVVLLKETLYPRYLIGAAMILPCVWFIARRGAVPPVEMD